MANLSGDLVRHHLPTRVFGQNVVYTPKVGSTNTELKALAEQDAPEGLLYLTEEQLSGRGRLDRRWLAPPGSSLLFSLLFRPGRGVAPRQAQRLTMICSLALAEAIEAQTGLRPAIKWPNDLLWHDGKKLAGILTELGFKREQLDWAVVGVGLNVNVDFRHHAPLSAIATSLSMILGRDTAAGRLPLLQKFLVNVEQRYLALQQGHLPHEEWAARLVGIGQTVTVSGADQTYQGLMTGVDENGALLLEQSGQIIPILAGDVSLRLPA